jgi:transcriptional regulator of NAD metabolism
MSETNGPGRRERIEELSGVVAVLPCAHDREGSQKELETLVAHGISSDTQPLSSLTGGVHRHRVRAPDDVALASARGDLELLGFLDEG